MCEKTDFGPGMIAKSIYSVGGLLSTVAFLMWYRDRPTALPDQFREALAWFILLFPLTVGIVGKAFERPHKRSNQLRRDQRAQFILEHARQGAWTGDYSVYIRGDMTTSRMPVHDPLFSGWGYDPRSPDCRQMDLETVFAEILDSFAPLVGLGRRGEQLGAGRVETDENHWRDDIKNLLASGSLIVVLPFPGAGFQWEIEWIQEHGYLNKSMFVMPPKKRWFLHLPRRLRPIRWPEVWETMSERLSKRGLILPAYEKDGMVFFLGDDGKVTNKASLVGQLDRKWTPQIVRYVLDEAAKRHALPAD